jgi:hypothetical protein
MVLYAFGVTVLTYIICGDYIALQVLLMKKDYKCHTCTKGIPSIQDSDLELYYLCNGHISIHYIAPPIWMRRDIPTHCHKCWIL